MDSSSIMNSLLYLYIHKFLCVWFGIYKAINNNLGLLNTYAVRCADWIVMIIMASLEKYIWQVYFHRSDYIVGV